MDIKPFDRDLIPEAAALFIEDFNRLRARLPILPDRLANPDLLAEKLSHLIDASPAFVAVDAGRLVGYIGAFLIDGFRGTDRKAAYCPEWGHSVASTANPAVSRMLYRAVSAGWYSAGCQTHAITLFAHDPAVERIWFWQGFGLTVVDGIRSLDPILSPDRSAARLSAGFTVHQAAPDDIPDLVAIEAEHWQHYRQPPVFMVTDDARDAAGFAEFLDTDHHSAWLATMDGEVLSYMLFEGQSFGAAESVGSDTTVAITGAFTRPAYRGQGAAASVLDAALRAYAARGFERCSVDFESFNPEAANFWLKYFDPVCYSLLRVPERVG